MAAKNDIDITIGGKTITLSGVESEEYLREVASYLNGKLREFADDASYWRLPNDMRSVMLQLNLADDYFKEHARVQELEEQVQALEEHRDRALGELEDLQGAAREAAARITALESDAAGLRDQAQRAAAAENSAAKRFGAEKSRAERLSEEMEALRKSKAEADKAIERLKQELANTRENLQGELGKTRTDLEQRLEASEEQRKKEVGELQAQLKREAQEAEALRQKEVGELQKKHEKETKDAQERSRKEIRELRSSYEKELKKVSDESAERGKSLQKAEEEIKTLRVRCEAALSNEKNTRSKLETLKKTYSEQLASETESFRTETQQANEELVRVQEELTILQEQENTRLQAAAKVRSTMQELVQQYGRFGQSLEEAAEQMRTLE